MSPLQLRRRDFVERALRAVGLGDAHGVTLVSAVVSLAHAFGMRTVAEGIIEGLMLRDRESIQEGRRLWDSMAS